MNGAPHILMCPPEYYGIHYEINPWMSRSRQADHGRAARQWERLKELIESCGARVSLLEPVEGLPDLVFTANAAMIYRGTAILSRFRHPQRQGEEPYYASWFERQGWRVQRLPEELYFEGAGDALFCGDTLLGGYRIRSDVAAHQQVARMLDRRVIPLELVDPYYYHLDTCVCPLAPGVAIYYPGALDAYGQRVLDGMLPELIELDVEEAAAFAANAVVIGRTVITNAGCPRLRAELRRRGWDAAETPLDEFVKAGGSAKCLTLRLDGEEAAGWKYE